MDITIDCTSKAMSPMGNFVIPVKELTDYTKEELIEKVKSLSIDKENSERSLINLQVNRGKFLGAIKGFLQKGELTEEIVEALAINSQM